MHLVEDLTTRWRFICYWVDSVKTEVEKHQNGE